jgi:hypothetical protein
MHRPPPFKDKQAFREQWKACRITNLTGHKSQVTTDNKTTGMKGVYQPRSIIVKKEGADDEAIEAADKYILKCLRKGPPWVTSIPHLGVRKHCGTCVGPEGNTR